jgi:hypothetical protein
MQGFCYAMRLTLQGGSVNVAVSFAPASATLLVSLVLGIRLGRGRTGYAVVICHRLGTQGVEPVCEHWLG